MDHSPSQSDCIPVREIPVLLTIFNRPEKTKAVMENLRQIKPRELFVAADGPRRNNEEDIEKCRKAREEATAVEWPCDVRTRFLEENVGCDTAVPSALEWFFQHVAYGIIVEDDCIPQALFFAFCGELLARYRNDQRVMQISALSPYAAREHCYDYHFSRTYRPSGSWCTWRRAWKHYAPDLGRYGDEEAFAILKAYHQDHAKLQQRYRMFQQFKKGSLHYWDFKWAIACYAQNGLNIVPERNLMMNLGFDEDSTHTRRINPVFENLRVQALRSPLRHPPFVYADSKPERSLEKRIYRSLSMKSRCMYLLRKTLGTISYLRETMPYR